MPQDWFDQNAPKAEGQDWFEANAAKPPAAKPPDRPGYFRRLGQSFGIPTSMEELKGAIPPMPKSLSEGAQAAFKKSVDPVGLSDMTTNYLRTAGQGIKKGYQEVKEAGTNIGEGGPIGANIGKAASGTMEAATGLTPFVGPTIRTAGEDWFNKNYRGALGGMTGTVLQLMGFDKDVRGKASELGKASAERGTKNIATALDTPGGKGGAKATTMLNDLNDAKADLADIQRTQPLKSSGAARFHELSENIDAKQERIWDEAHKPQVQRFRDKPVNHEWIANEAAKALPPELEDAAPQESANASKWIQDTLAKPRNLQQLDNLLRDINADIKGKNYEAYGPKGIKVRQAAAKAIRTEIDNVLEKNGETGVRSVNRRWGALENIKTRAQERSVQLARSESKTGAFTDWVKPYVFLHPDWGTLTGISANISKLKRSPASRLTGGMKELGRTGMESPPNPPFRLVPPQGEEIRPEQLSLPGDMSPDVTQPNFKPGGRRDVSFPATSQGSGSRVIGGVLYLWDGKKWVHSVERGLSPMPKLKSGQGRNP